MESKKSAPINIASLLNKIDFSPERVVDAACENSLLFVQAIEYRRQCLEKAKNAKMSWEKGKAEKDLSIRRNARQNDEKVTEGHITSQILVDPGVDKLAQELSKAEVHDEYSKLVVEAFRMRRDCLRIVDDLVRDEVGLQRAVEAGSEKLQKLRKDVSERYPEG